MDSTRHSCKARVVPIDAFKNKRQKDREHAELVRSVWAMKTIHGMTLQSISREYGIGYCACEDLLVEGAAVQVEKARRDAWLAAKFFYSPMPTPPVVAMRRAA